MHPTPGVHRRTLVAGLAALGAGCLGAPASPDSTTTATDTATTTTPTTTAAFGDSIPHGDGSVTVSEFRVRHSAVEVQADTADVVTFDDRLALVTVSARGEDRPPRSAFSFVSGDATRGAYRSGGGSRASPFYRLPDAYVPGERTGWIGFELPADREYRDPEVRLETDEARGTWPVPGDAVASLRRPLPEFALESFDAPETVSEDDLIEVTATVSNEGGRGFFRGSVNTGGVLHKSHPFSFEVPAGGSRTGTVLHRSPRGPGQLHLTLVGTGDISSERRTVTIE